VPEKARLTQLALDLPENDPAVTAARLARLEELAGQWRNGAEFTSLLTPAPDGLDPAFSGPQPPVPLGDLHPDLARAVAALAPGEISAPVTLPGIAFVVRLDERLPGGRKPFDDVRGEIELNLRRAEGEKISRAFVEKLRQKHFVRIIRDRLGRPTEP